MMGNETSKATTTTWAGSTAAARVLTATLFSVAAAVALLLATAGAASAYTPPSAPNITAPAEGSYEPDGNFVLSGTAQPNTTVKVFEGPVGQYWVGTANVDPSGRWSLNLGGVVMGRHAYKARVTDQMSRYSDWSNIRTVTVDPPQLLQKQDTTVQQAEQDSKRLVEEAQRLNLARAVGDHFENLRDLAQDLQQQQRFVSTMPVGGIGAAEMAVAIFQHEALAKSISELSERNEQLRILVDEMRRITERCASACSAEDQARLDSLKAEIEYSASDGQLTMIQLQNAMNMLDEFTELQSNGMKKASDLDAMIIRTIA